MSLFEEHLAQVLKQRLAGPHRLEDPSPAQEVWSALANVEWTHTRTGAKAFYSFRSAGNLIADIVGDGSNYLTYYCNSEYATVAPWISEGMAAKGWKHGAYS